MAATDRLANYSDQAKADIVFVEKCIERWERYAAAGANAGFSLAESIVGNLYAEGRLS